MDVVSDTSSREPVLLDRRFVKWDLLGDDKVTSFYGQSVAIFCGRAISADVQRAIRHYSWLLVFLTPGGAPSPVESRVEQSAALSRGD